MAIRYDATTYQDKDAALARLADTSPATRLLRADYLLLAGDMEGARALYRTTAAMLEPGMPEGMRRRMAWYRTQQLARTYESTGAYEEARTHLQQVAQQALRVGNDDLARKALDDVAWLTWRAASGMPIDADP